jgi:hypothetical protein
VSPPRAQTAATLLLATSALACARPLPPYTYVDNVTEAPGGAWLAGPDGMAVLGGKVNGIAEIGARGVVVMACDTSINAVGVVAAGASLRLVTRYGALWDVSPSGCRCIDEPSLLPFKPTSSHPTRDCR